MRQESTGKKEGEDDDEARATKRVAFETLVRVEADETAPLKLGGRTGSMDLWSYSAPWGYRMLERATGGRGFSLQTNRMLVWSLTFLCYTAYHASRKPPSIVKSVLHGEPQGDAMQGGISLSGYPGWAPFSDKRTGKALLGDLDLAFLGAYSLSMFVAGHLGDRLDLRHFLTGGMLGSGLCVVMFGAAYFLNIHNLSYFITVQIVGGLFQATGWPSVVSVMGNWFGKGKRGLIMGIWNAHTSIGNIVGTLLAAYALRWGWGWSFMLPGFFMLAAGVVIFLFLVVEPQDIGFLPQSGSVLPSAAMSQVETPRSGASGVGGDDDDAMSDDARAYLERRLRSVASRGEERAALLPAHAASVAAHHKVHGAHGRHGLWGMGSTLVLVDPARRDSTEGSEKDFPLGFSGSPSDGTPGAGGGGYATSRGKAGVSFATAWMIPGVAVYAMTLFFAKLVAYTFLYWLPYYINATEVGGRKLTPEQAGNLSILFDVGGVLGGALAGYLSDVTGASAVVSCSFVYLAIPFLYLYRAYGSLSLTINIALMMTAGFFVNGPYALITTAVSADLGSHSSLRGNEKALATVTAIIDGMGSCGAALGPMVTGYISEAPGGFDNVFIMLCGAAMCGGLLLTQLVYRELREMWGRRTGSERAGEGEGALLLLAADEADAHEAFAYLPPGEGAAERTVDNETGRMV